MPLAGSDPAVAAYERWAAVYRARHAYSEAADDLDDDDPQWAQLLDDEHDAEDALADAIATTPEGAAAKVTLLLVMLGCADGLGSTCTDPETFTAWNRTNEGDKHCALTLLDGLRGMQALTGHDNSEMVERFASACPNWIEPDVSSTVVLPPMSPSFCTVSTSRATSS